MIRVSQIRDGKWLAEGDLDRIRHDQGWLAEGGFSVTNLGNLRPQGAPMWPKAPQLAKRACPPRRGLEGEPRSGSNF